AYGQADKRQCSSFATLSSGEVGNHSRRKSFHRGGALGCRRRGKVPSVSAVKWVVRGIRDGISGVSSGGLRKLLEMEGFVGGTRAASPALGLPGMGIRVFSGLGSTVGRRRHA